MKCWTCHVLLGLSLIWQTMAAAGWTESEYPIWEVIQWPSADQMRHLKTFVLSEGRRYQDLMPSVERLTPNRSGNAKSLDGWAYCAATASRDVVLMYFEQDCPQATLSGLPAGRNYELHWYDPRTGHWRDAAPTSETITADSAGTIRLPSFPGGKVKSDSDWALKLRSLTMSVNEAE